MGSTHAAPTACGRRLRHWRQHRGLSQLELAVRADLSQRHVSFIETGRTRPRRAAVMRLAEALDIPLRERNVILEFAGLSPCYPEILLSSAAVASFCDAVGRLLHTHEPYPAYVLDRWWRIVDANAAGRAMLPALASGTVDVVDAFLAPGSVREVIENFAAVAWTLVSRLRREVDELGADERLQSLLERAERYLRDVPRTEQSANDLVVCPHLRIDGETIRTISMVARFGTAREITLDELRVELVYPADDAAEAFFRRGIG